MNFIIEFWQDVKAFGGVPLYAAVFALALAFGLKVLAVQLGIGFVLAWILTITIRLVYFKRRPVPQHYKSFFGKIDAASFPSLHTMRATVLGVLLMLTFPSAFTIIAFSIIIFGVAISRIKLERHFVSDVIAGVIIGTLIALASIKLAGFFQT